MNQIKSLFINLFTVFTLVLFTACPFNPDNEFYLRGKEISNYPEWLNPYHGESGAAGVSEWLDWQGEQGKSLHDYVPENIISKDFNGKFRLHLGNQDTHLVFNDSKSTAIVILYNWVAEVKSCSNGIDIPQKDIENKFEYGCYAKKSLYDEETDENKAQVVLTRLESSTTENRFNYKLKIAGNLVIDCNMKNNFILKEVPIDIEKYVWIPYEVGWLKLNKTKNAIKFEQSYYFDMGKSLTVIENCIECYEGISSIRGKIDDANKTISFNLVDTEQCDYITLKIADDLKNASIVYYKLENGETKIVRYKENLLCSYYFTSYY